MRRLLANSFLTHGRRDQFKRSPFDILEAWGRGVFATQAGYQPNKASLECNDGVLLLGTLIPEDSGMARGCQALLTFLLGLQY